MLDRFTDQELRSQIDILAQMEEGIQGDRKQKNRRRTLRRQRERIMLLLSTRLDSAGKKQEDFIPEERQGKETRSSCEQDAQSSVSIETSAAAAATVNDRRLITENPKNHVNGAAGFFWQY